MHLNGDDIVEASLLEPTGEELGTSTTQEEEATQLGEEPEPPEVPVASASLLECLETPKAMEPTKLINTPSTSVPSSPTQQLCHHFSQKTKKSWQGIEANPSLTSEWIWSYIDKNERMPDWWREFWSILCSKDKLFSDVQVKELACQQDVAFSLPSAQVEKSGWWNAPSCLGVLGRKDFLPPKKFQGMRDVQMVRWEETVALALALQRCTIQSGIPQAFQELCRCLTPLLDRGNLLDLTMLGVAEKGSMTPPVPAERASSPEPRKEEPTSPPSPNKLPALEPKEASHSGELVLRQRRWPPAPTGFTCSWVDKSGPPPLEDKDLLVNITLGAQLYLSSLGSLQVTVSHHLMMGEIQYQYQSMVISSMSLQLDLSKCSDHPNSPWQLKEP